MRQVAVYILIKREYMYEELVVEILYVKKG